MSSKKVISKKVILMGSFCVGKTSLISSFVYRKFSSIYQTTLGVRIDKKLVPCDDIDINMIIWDIGGEIDNSKIPKSYYLGAGGVIYVIDITRDYEKENLDNELEFLKKELPNVPIIIIANKVDLIDQDEIDSVLSKIPIKVDYLTSAKTGENVETIFSKLAYKMI